MGNKLKEVTYLTVKDLKKHDIILPGQYSITFENMAKKLEVDFTKEDIILKDLHHNEDHLDSIVKKTSENLTLLQQSTSEAQIAIKNKDEESLSAINVRLSMMEEQIDYLQKELFSDTLTDAYNRKWFTDYYLRDLKFKNNGHIAFLDLNKFKFINDNYGHTIGDQVLKYLVKFLQKELNSVNADIVRYAGDEFIVLFKKDAILDATQTMQDVATKLSKQKLKSAKIKDLQFSFSYGLMSFKIGDDVEPVLEEVDKLMYIHKESLR